MLCPLCGTRNRDKARFCKKCGKIMDMEEKAMKLTVSAEEAGEEPEEGLLFCPGCGSENKPGVEICEVCGTPLNPMEIEVEETRDIEEASVEEAPEQPVQEKEKPVPEILAPSTADIEPAVKEPGPKPPAKEKETTEETHPAPRVKICPNCGAENRKTSSFCRICGKNLPRDSEIRLAKKLKPYLEKRIQEVQETPVPTAEEIKEISEKPAPEPEPPVVEAAPAEEKPEVEIPEKEELKSAREEPPTIIEEKPSEEKRRQEPETAPPAQIEEVQPEIEVETPAPEPLIQAKEEEPVPEPGIQEDIQAEEPIPEPEAQAKEEKPAPEPVIQEAVKQEEDEKKEEAPVEPVPKAAHHKAKETRIKAPDSVRLKPLPGRFCGSCGYENTFDEELCVVCGASLFESDKILSGVKPSEFKPSEVKTPVKAADEKPVEMDPAVPEVPAVKVEEKPEKKQKEKVQKPAPPEKAAEPEKPKAPPAAQATPEEEEGDKKFCPNCGYENRPSAGFCKICGKRFDEEESEVSEIASAVEKKPAPASKKPEKPPQADEKELFSTKLTSLEETPLSLQNGRYEIMKVLGAGGTGRLFLARDTRMGIDIVLKELHPIASDKKTVEYLEKRFVEEAKLLFRLTHPGFPRVVDYFTEANRLFIIMQYVEGKNLQALLKEQPEGRFDLDTCLKWLDKMLELLIVLQRHEPPIIHRDIKPANIMIDKHDCLFLVDFGFARTIDSGSKTRVGTYGYASPEHFSGNFVISSDIFSLGATFHHLITGESPQTRKDPFSYPPIGKYIPDFPGELQQIFDKMMSLSKAFRYQNAQEVKDDLDKFMKNYHKGA